MNSGAWEIKTSLNSGNLTFNSSIMRENKEKDKTKPKKKEQNRFEEHLVKGIKTTNPSAENIRRRKSARSPGR